VKRFSSGALTPLYDPHQGGTNCPTFATPLLPSTEAAGERFRYELEQLPLSRRHRQQRDPAQHRSEPLPIQMSFCQEKPVIARVFHHPSSGFDPRCCDSLVIIYRFFVAVPAVATSYPDYRPAGSVTAALGSSEIDEDRLVIFTACLPSLIHCSAVPRCYRITLPLG
jgi:hypothetical protein